MGEQIATHYGLRTINVLTGFKFIGEQIGKLEKQGRADSYVFGFEAVSYTHLDVYKRQAIENTRLGIPYLFSEEALHGLMTNNAPSFPQQIGLAASFEPELGREMGHAIAAESRACGCLLYTSRCV